MLPDEPCLTSPEVRAELNRLRDVKSASGVGLLEYASRPDLPPSLRLKLQRKFLEPVYEKFFQADVEAKKQEQEQKKGQGQGEKGEGQEGGEPGEPANPEDILRTNTKSISTSRPTAPYPKRHWTRPRRTSSIRPQGGQERQGHSGGEGQAEAR